MSGPVATPIQRCLNRLKTGDVRARDDLFTVCHGRLRVLARKMFDDFARLQRWVQADDVLQDACIRLDRCLREVSPATTREFLRLAALQIRRELLDLIDRHCGPHGLIENYVTPPTGTLNPDGSASGPADRAEDPARIALWTEFHEQVERLPDELREIFDLRWYHGLTHEEITVEIGASLSTVRRRWLLARMRLAEHLPLPCLPSL